MSKKKSWTLRKEKYALEQNLKRLSPADQEYDETLNALQKINSILDGNTSVGVKIFETISKVSLGAIIGIFAMTADKNERVLPHTETKGLFRGLINKFF